MLYLLAVVLLLSPVAHARVAMTGDALADFVTNYVPGDFLIVKVPDPSGTPDVGVPSQVDAGDRIVSGWDINSIYFQWNPDADELYVGIDCYVICGDADGRLGPDTTSPQLASIGGEDTADLSGSESFAISIDWTNEGKPQHIIGVPGGNPISGQVLPCSTATDAFSMRACFGLYQHARLPAQVAPAFQFLAVSSYPTTNFNPQPSASRPDLEFLISGVTQIKKDLGSPFKNPYEPWNFRVNAFAGSFVDSGVGEDYLPDQTNFVTVPFPCSQFDKCDVCFGDGTTCTDCKGIANGPNKYDACDVCGGDGKSCADCKGVSNGPNKYDVCDVCAGNGKTCLDCAGMPNGPNKYDVCDVCKGDGSSCLPDCLGRPAGTATYDVCGVCNGNGKSCLDCNGVPNGGAVYDSCGICDGDGSSCIDCKGVARGRATYDVCDVCAGDGSSCIDCKGIPLGPHTYDRCDVCGGNGKSCLDCAGEPFGCLRVDICHICGGDGTSCLDCMGIPFGPHVYSDCGKCIPPPLDQCKVVPEQPMYMPVHEERMVDDYYLVPERHHEHHRGMGTHRRVHVYDYDNLNDGRLNKYVHASKSYDGNDDGERSFYAYENRQQMVSRYYQSDEHDYQYQMPMRGHAQASAEGHQRFSNMQSMGHHYGDAEMKRGYRN